MPVLLVLHRTGPHRHIGQQVGQVQVVFRVQHFVGAGEARLGNCPQVDVPDGDDALEHVRLMGGIGLVDHSLVALPVGAGLVGVDAGNDQQLFLHLLLDPDQPGDVVQHRFLRVG